ncbi:MAG: helix-turn-helix transcriptional regulator [Mycobacterium sp.]
MYDELRNLLLQRRRELGLTQRELGRRTGMKQANISELETGHIDKPTLDTLARWASGLEITFQVQLSYAQATVAVVTRAPLKNSKRTIIVSARETAALGD